MNAELVWGSHIPGQETFRIALPSEAFSTQFYFFISLFTGIRLSLGSESSPCLTWSLSLHRFLPAQLFRSINIFTFNNILESAPQKTQTYTIIKLFFFNHNNTYSLEITFHGKRFGKCCFKPNSCCQVRNYFSSLILL